MKYVLVTGGVLSGIGKGIISSSIGTILKANGWNVTCIKIDPYLNIDAGTFSPYEHGEVYVLDDGSEVDLDLGNYERFLDITLTKDNNITTGKIYKMVMEKERRGDYLGKTVQVVPHITDAIMQWVADVALIPVDDNGNQPEVCIIELGGTIGDIESMPFVEAFRQMLFRVGGVNFCCVHVSLFPQLASVGEPKTKPTQASVRELRALGLHPDFLMCRCSITLPKSVINKISLFSQVPEDHVIMAVDVDDLYEVPIRLNDQNMCQLLLKHFQLSPKTNIEEPILGKWKALTYRLNHASEVVRVGLVGKYTKLNDSYISLLKALRHAAIYANLKLHLEWICAEDLEETNHTSNPDSYHQAWLSVSNCQAIVVPGGFGSRGIEGKIAAIKFCRERGTPFLGLCLGLQCAVIEFARNVLGWEDANSTEFNANSKHPVVIDMPEHNPGQMGGTMRLGKRRTALSISPTARTYLAKVYQSKPVALTNSLPKHGAGDEPNSSPLLDSVVHRLINASYFDARHRHRYEVNPEFVDKLEEAGLFIVGRDADIGNRMEIIELFSPLDTSKLVKEMSPEKLSTVPQIQRHPFFVATQFHPEYTSRPARPSVFFLGLLLAASNRLNGFLRCPIRLSPTQILLDDSPDCLKMEFPLYSRSETTDSGDRQINNTEISDEFKSRLSLTQEDSPCQPVEFDLTS